MNINEKHREGGQSSVALRAATEILHGTRMGEVDIWKVRVGISFLEDCGLEESARSYPRGKFFLSLSLTCRIDHWGQSDWGSSKKKKREVQGLLSAPVVPLRGMIEIERYEDRACSAYVLPIFLSGFKFRGRGGGLRYDPGVGYFGGMVASSTTGASITLGDPTVRVRIQCVLHPISARVGDDHRCFFFPKTVDGRYRAERLAERGVSQYAIGRGKKTQREFYLVYISPGLRLIIRVLTWLCDLHSPSHR